jgi:NAD(P)-dependent dehydrogenase (short-subunit alcohol dehydrogenase family)
MPNHNQQERVILISGSTGGLGSIVAPMFAQAGWIVALTDLDPATLPHHTARLRQGHSPRTIIGRRTDVTDTDQVGQLVSQVVAQHGRLDALLNLVGGYQAGTRLADLPDLDSWQAMWRLNVLSTVVMCRAAIPALRMNGWGRIVNIGSRAAQQPAAKSTAYGASKAAVVNFTQALAQEEKTNHINANVILPGTIDTPANRQAMPDADVSRWVTPQQLGETMLFLCSDAAAAITGAVIAVYNRS